MILNQYGEIVKKSWKDLQNHYPGINDEVYIVMPNHVHGIIVIYEEKRRAGSHISLEAEYLRKPAPTNPRTLSEIIRAFKTYSPRGINEFRHSAGKIVWQRGFYEHVIRTEKEYREIGEYIIYNPNKWENDSENADSTIGDF